MCYRPSGCISPVTCARTGCPWTPNDVFPMIVISSTEHTRKVVRLPVGVKLAGIALTHFRAKPVAIVAERMAKERRLLR